MSTFTTRVLRAIVNCSVLGAWSGSLSWCTRGSEAFLAGGFSPATAEPFLRTIQGRLAQAASISAAGTQPVERPR
jgi:hypothetical protein